jgi:hypothetical protein
MKLALGCWREPAVIKDRRSPERLNFDSIRVVNAFRMMSIPTQVANPKAVSLRGQGRRMGKIGVLAVCGGSAIRRVLSSFD